MPPDRSLIGARYRLDHVLGQGGMGVVWAGTDLNTGERVALKLLKGTDTHEAGMRRFHREARAAMALHHPNIVQVRELTEDVDGAPVMVMELLEGESLAARLLRKKRLDLAELATIIVQIVSAVGAAHAAGIVHRDLKPDNVFLVGPNSSVRVLDFGIAKLTAREGDAAASTALTGTGAMLGTPFYMAPEQVFGERDLDHRADIWALGVIAYECLSGRRPFEGENFGQVFKAITRGELHPLRLLAPHLPPDVLSIVDRMLAIERQSRVALAEVLAVFSKHTEAAVEPFSAPTLPLSSAPYDPLAPTIASELPPPGAALTPGVLVRTSPGPSMPPPPDASVTAARRKLPWVWMAAGAIVVIGASMAFATLRQNGATETGGRATENVIPTAASASSVALAASASTSATSASTTSLVPSTSSSAPSSSTSAATAGSVASDRPAAPRPAIEVKPAAPAPSQKAPAVSASASASVARTPEPKASVTGKKTIAGGVVEPPPF